MLAVVSACTGEIDHGVLEDRAATNTVIAGETQAAGALATATANAERANVQATRFAGGNLPTSTPNVSPGGRTPTARPTRVLPTVATSPQPGVTPESSVVPETTPVSATPVTVPTPTATLPPGNVSSSQGPVLIGPLSGSLEHLATDEHAEELRANVEVTNFLATATFQNPFVSQEKDWTIGMWLRVERSDALFWTRGFSFPGIRNNGLLLVIDASKRWRLIERTAVVAPQGRNVTDTLIQQGVVNGLNLEQGGSNTVSIAAYGDRGTLIVNGLAIATLDLSGALQAGDIVAVGGVDEDDEFAGSTTEITDFQVSEALEAADAASGSEGIGRLSAGQPAIAFQSIEGDFVFDADFPVQTPVFSGPWSWQITVQSETQAAHLSVGSDFSTRLVLHEVLDDGSIEISTLFSSTLNTLTRERGDINSAQISVIDGRLGIVINDVMMPGIDVVPDADYDIVISALVRGETATNAVVTAGMLRLWQPGDEDDRVDG